jgi:hypothetical protein
VTSTYVRQHAPDAIDLSECKPIPYPFRIGSEKMPTGGKRSLDLSLVSSASKRWRSDKRKGEISRFCEVVRTDYQCRRSGLGSALMTLLDPDL